MIRIMITRVKFIKQHRDGNCKTSCNSKDGDNDRDNRINIILLIIIEIPTMTIK